MHQTNYTALGEGQPVILIHGMTASLHDWDSLLPEIASSGYRVYALDLLGHGESAKPEHPHKYFAEEFYRHFANWLAGLELRRPPVLVGHSLGGHLSLAYALQYPQSVKGLMLIDPFYSPEQLQPMLRYLSLRPAIGERALRHTPLWLFQLATNLDLIDAIHFTGETKRQIALDYKRASPHIMYLPGTLPDLTHRLREIKHPVHVIWGEKDLTLDPRSFPKMVAAMHGARGNVIRNCGHQPHISKPLEVLDLILNFLAALQGNSGLTHPQPTDQPNSYPYHHQGGR